MVSTTACGRPLKSAASRPGATHGGSTGLDAGAKWCRAPEKGGPSSEEWPGRGCREENEFGKPGPGGPERRDQQDLLLVLPDLHSVCASRLTGGNAYLHRARGQLCASASVPRVPSVREKQLAVGGLAGSKQVYLSFPNRLQISRIVSGWSRHSPGKVSCRESASAARLSSPGMWTARSDLSRVWLQRRRWRASCDMRRDRIPPIRLIYDTAAVLSTDQHMLA